ncbi:hypothetical protein [Brumimicrobium oceani]|uniref:Uncharacterized protein n=1 Tax=Brumimicrobium oceani TaxID=2100725 RepID=A0A2U2XFM5_9FLAO|nr:hypothetical protein [Brumimicrobium oceani]PWH86598.1 hypothetical protein DIT68_05020 [Brumimicrobium oceani]
MEHKTLKELIQKLGELHKEAVKHTLSLTKPEAERLIQNKSKDIKVIERTLDALLETAFDEEVLIVYKKLCRYYYDIDQRAAIQYVDFYREMWDSDLGD